MDQCCEMRSTLVVVLWRFSETPIVVPVETRFVEVLVWRTASQSAVIDWQVRSHAGKVCVSFCQLR